MIKLYTRLAAMLVLLAFATTAMAQRNKMIFNSAVSSSWQTPQNWSRNGVQQTSSGVIPQNNDSIVITKTSNGNSAQIVGKDPVVLNNVILVVQAGAQLLIGNGSGNGANKGVLTLDNASSVSIEANGTNRGEIKSNSTGNGSNQITLGSTTIFAGGVDYNALFPSTGSSQGDLFGAAHATSTTAGFAFGALPVILTGFNAGLTNGNKVNITWTTQQEENVDHFEIDHSSDGLRWQAVATVKATGFSSTPESYSCSDASPQAGANLYRVKAIDINGAFLLSSIVNVRLNLLGKISLFPNPATNLLMVSLSKAPASDWSVSLVNGSGQVLLQKKFSKDQTTISLPVTNYPTGNYTVEITDGGDKQSSGIMIAHQ